ncbi:Cell shape-determining protein MreC [Tenacibaculum litopenaei]|jgi:rod shape-determining protein MreC|uniref:rod shape-determining protein MreC n=1 Tax=Tenacibaculum litopenaei TaxID=396016 RepID=UPI0038959249
MQQLIYFFQKYKYFLYFLCLEFIAVALIINNHSFHKSKFVGSANAVTGGLLTKVNSVKEYANLKTENQQLLDENTRLKNKLAALQFTRDSLSGQQLKDSILYGQKFQYISGKIIDNSFARPYNFLTINRGKNHQISAEMAVVNARGIIGVTEQTSDSYARVRSILNKNSKINARFKNSTHYGTLEWNGEDYQTVQLTDIPRQAVFQIGDTIITDGKSEIFPEGILIGTVQSVPEKISALNTINVRLFNDMSSLGQVNIIRNFDKQEIQTLENQNE